MNTEEHEHQVISIQPKAGELAADTRAVFYDISGQDLESWDDIRPLIRSIKFTPDTMVTMHREENGYQ